MSFIIIENVNYLLAAGTILLQVMVIVVAALYIGSRSWRSRITGLAGRYGLVVALLIALVATVMSLYYSNILGYAPCNLCWWQRIFIYPQLILLGLGAWRKDRGIIDYSLLLLVIGLLVSLYQVYLQIGGDPLGACGIVGAASCTQLYVYEFGYVTIPVMALTSYIAMIVALLLAKKSAHSPSA